MTLILSGTDGLSDVDGSAATPAIRGTDTNTGIFFPAADTIAFSEGGVESMRLDSSGNLLVGTTSASTPGTGFISVANTFGFKNRIINGGMVIDQRNAGASVTQTTANLYGVDRWQTVGSVTSKFTFQQSTTAPTGFINSTVITSSAATSVGSSDFYLFQQLVEGLNMTDLAWGTASAQSVTLSFWVRSSLTGTFGGAISNDGNNRSYPFTYTINAANTWEQKTVTIAGDTTGTWLTTSGCGMKVRFSMGVGSTYAGTAGAWAASDFRGATGCVNVVGTSGATWFVTGVQLERGSTATSFDFRPYGTELMLCQRYYQTANVIVSAVALTSTNYFLKTTMRASPTIAGGGAGFSSSYSNADVFGMSQTTAAQQVLTMSSEL